MLFSEPKVITMYIRQTDLMNVSMNKLLRWKRMFGSGTTEHEDIQREIMMRKFCNLYGIAAAQDMMNNYVRTVERYEENSKYRPVFDVEQADLFGDELNGERIDEDFDYDSLPTI